MKIKPLFGFGLGVIIVGCIATIFPSFYVLDCFDETNYCEYRMSDDSKYLKDISIVMAISGLIILAVSGLVYAENAEWKCHLCSGVLKEEEHDSNYCVGLEHKRFCNKCGEKVNHL